MILDASEILTEDLETTSIPFTKVLRREVLNNMHIGQIPTEIMIPIRCDGKVYDGIRIYIDLDDEGFYFSAFLNVAAAISRGENPRSVGECWDTENLELFLTIPGFIQVSNWYRAGIDEEYVSTNYGDIRVEFWLDAHSTIEEPGHLLVSDMLKLCAASEFARHFLNKLDPASDIFRLMIGTLLTEKNYIGASKFFPKDFLLGQNICDVGGVYDCIRTSKGEKYSDRMFYLDKSICEGGAGMRLNNVLQSLYSAAHPTLNYIGWIIYDNFAIRTNVHPDDVNAVLSIIVGPDAYKLSRLNNPQIYSEDDLKSSINEKTLEHSDTSKIENLVLLYIAEIEFFEKYLKMKKLRLEATKKFF